ncbi:MAG: ABC transporter permease [Bacteroidota bacterium]
MIKNFFKTAYRNLLKHKGFTAINILGLSLGLASCLFIVLYVADELSYDRFNKHAGRIYRVDDDIKYNSVTARDALCPAPMAATLASLFPEIENTIRFRQRGSFHVRLVFKGVIKCAILDS